MKANCLEQNGKTCWQGTLDMIYLLCNEQADLSYDYRDFNGWNMPCVDFRLDAPSEIALPQSSLEKIGIVDRWDVCSVVLGDVVPEGIQSKHVFAMRETSTAASIYRAFKMTLSIIRQLSLPAEFLWSSVVLAPLSNNIDVLLDREKKCWELGSIHTIWLRCEQDDLVKAAMEKVISCGELRVQNMTTANTWIAGRNEDSRLMEAINQISNNRSRE